LRLSGYVENEEVIIADFTRLRTVCPYLAFIPQWDFLDFLADHAREFPAFTLRMQAEVYSLIQNEDRVGGVRARTPNGELVVNADLVIAADGRHSVVRERAGLTVKNFGAPIDVLWMRLSRKPDDPAQPLGRITRGGIFVMIYRATYWQCGYVIAKGGYDAVRAQGLEVLRDRLAQIAPMMMDRVAELRSWDDIKLLTVTVDRLKHWHSAGLLCIGDAAHAMSPVGGVGINLAIQDAVAAANLLTGPLLAHRCTRSDLRRVQRRRLLPTRLIQTLQVIVQERIISRVMHSDAPLSIPWILRLLQRYPVLRALPAWLIGIGIRPEHVRVPASAGTAVPKHASSVSHR
jgi:2-polyprenyl-6-methoxyphenol hydroxylase-like FAD-dependent oxidoreductase